MWLKLSLFLTECGKSTNCRLRLLFIDICDMILDTFSRSFFKENFFEAVLELAHVSEKDMHASAYQHLLSLAQLYYNQQHQGIFFGYPNHNLSTFCII